MKITKSRIVAAICSLILLSKTSVASIPETRKEQSQQDSAKIAYFEDMALKNSLMRQIQVSTEDIPSRNIETSLNDEDFLTGKAQIIRNSFFLRLPLLTVKQSAFNLSMGSFNQLVYLSDIQSLNKNITIDNDVLSKTTLNLSLGYSTRTSIFNKPAFINASFSSLLKPDFSESVLSGTGVVLLNLKRTKKTNLAVGLAVAISPNTKIPAFILFSYEHHFTASNLDLSLNLPYRMALRKPLGKNNSISFINELSGTFAFYNIRNSYFPERSRYGTSEVKSGLTLERRLGKKLVVGASCGALYITSSRMKESTSYWGNSYFLKNKSTLDPYFSISISMLPFF
jgi:hypothetical protein